MNTTVVRKPARSSSGRFSSAPPPVVVLEKAVAEKPAPLTLLVDELGDLEAQLAPWRAKFGRLEVVRAAVRAAFASSDPAAAYTANGSRWYCLISAAGSQSVVDREALLKLVGAEKYAEVSSVSIKALTQGCGASVVGSVVSSRPTGPRALTLASRVVTD